MARVLGEACADGNSGLHTSQERRSVYNDLVPALPLVSSLIIQAAWSDRLVIGLSDAQKAGNSSSERLGLVPAAISKRRVVRSR